VLFAYYADTLMSMPARVGVLLAAAALLGVNAWAATKNTTEFELVNITPDDSYVRDWFDLTNKYYGEGFVPFSVYTPSVAYHEAGTRETLNGLLDTLKDNKWVDSQLSDGWLAAYLRWAACYNATLCTTGLDPSGMPARAAAGCGTAQVSGGLLVPPYCTMPGGANLSPSLLGDEGAFMKSLAAMMKDPQLQRYGRDLVYSNQDKQHLKSTRLATLYHTGLTDSMKEVEAMEAVQKVTGDSKASGLGDDPHPVFSYTQLYVFFYQYTIIYNELLVNFLLCLAACTFVCFFVLVHPLLCALVVLNVLLIDVNLLGLVYMSGLTIDSITVINLVMAVGLVVDYSAHMGHAFMSQSAQGGSRIDRMHRALVEMGPSVSLGGFTSFLGVMPTVFSTSYIFRIFFIMFCGIVGYGLFYGLTVLPVALSFIGPLVDEENAADIRNRQREQDERERQSAGSRELGV